MVLDHIAQAPAFFVITATLADAHLLTDGNLDVVNGIAIPQPLEDRIGEAKT